MSRANIRGDNARDLCVKEVCQDIFQEETFDRTPIRKVLIANIDPSTPHKLLFNTFAKFGRIESCILKKRKKRRVENQWVMGHFNQAQMEIQNEHQNEDQDQNQIQTDQLVKSYAFIIYETVEAAHRAIEAGHGRQISIRKQYLRVLPANSWNQPDNIDHHARCCRTCLKNKKENAPDTCPKSRSFSYNYNAEARHGFIDILNYDCLRTIFNFLPFCDQVRAGRVCKKWKEITEDAWLDRRRLDFNPYNWGFKYPDQSKSETKSELPHPDSCSVYKILAKCHSFLTHVDFSRSDNHDLGNSILTELVRMCPKMQSIDLREFDYSKRSIKALTRNHKNLKSIILGSPVKKCTFDNELSPLFSGNRNLTKVDIDCSMIEGHCLKHLPRKSVQELILRHPYCFLSHGIYKIFKDFKENLRVLKILSAPAFYLFHAEYIRFIESIGSCKKLEVLELPLLKDDVISHMKMQQLRSYLNNKNLIPLLNLKNLTKINLRGNYTFNDKFLSRLSQDCRKLKSVDISDCPHVNNAGVQYITSLPDLEYLCIDRLRGITDAVFIHGMPKLKTLLCSGCDDLHMFGILTVLHTASQLETLDLTNCSYIDNELSIYAILSYRNTQGRCVSMYLKGTNTRAAGVNIGLHWNYLRLYNEYRPE